MRNGIWKWTVLSLAAFLVTGAGFADEGKKKPAASGEMMMHGCEEHHAAAMKASDELTRHLAEAKRSTTLAEMRTHVEAADKALADMKTHMSQCMEMMDDGHAGMHEKMHGSGMAGAGAAPSEKKAAEKAVDPVCGMEVDPATAPSVTYQGKTYYFCSDGDKAKFEKSPEQYLKKS